MEGTPLCIVPNTYLETMRQKIQEQVAVYTGTVVMCDAEIVTRPGGSHSWLDIVTDNRSLLVHLGMFIGSHLTDNAEEIFQ